LWLLSVIVSEYSIIFVGLTGLVLLPSFEGLWYALYGKIIGISSVFLFLCPILKAFFISLYLSNDLQAALGHYTKRAVSNNRSSGPFSTIKLFQTVPKVPFRKVTYVTYDDASLTLDYYRSVVSGERPCIVVIHGGSWVSGDSEQLPELNYHLARAGYHVAAITYRLAPRWKCPAPIEDTAAALRYLRNHADELNIDINNFVLLGRSAGGQIALLTAYTIQQLGIKGVINFYGPADMIWGYKVPTNPLVLDSRATQSRYIGGDYNEVPKKYAASSPIEFVNKDTVPTLILHGTIDPMVLSGHAERLAAKLQQHGVSHYFLHLPWGTHGFDYHLNGPGGQLSTYAIEHFLGVVTEQ
jgi:acetyl esterase/lipase